MIRPVVDEKRIYSKITTRGTKTVNISNMQIHTTFVSSS